MISKRLVSILAVKLLDDAEEKFSDFGCNDLSEEWWDGISAEDRNKIYEDYYRVNGEEDDEDCGVPGDSCLMGYCSTRLRVMIAEAGDDGDS